MQRPDPDESARSNPSAMAMGRLKEVELDGTWVGIRRDP